MSFTRCKFCIVANFINTQTKIAMPYCYRNNITIPERAPFDCYTTINTQLVNHCIFYQQSVIPVFDMNLPNPGNIEFAAYNCQYVNPKTGQTQFIYVCENHTFEENDDGTLHHIATNIEFMDLTYLRNNKPRPVIQLDRFNGICPICNESLDGRQTTDVYKKDIRVKHIEINHQTVRFAIHAGCDIHQNFQQLINTMRIYAIFL